MPISYNLQSTNNSQNYWLSLVQITDQSPLVFNNIISTTEINEELDEKIRYVYNKLEKVRKEAVMSYFKYCSLISLEGLQKSIMSPSQTVWS
jgi:hypothetical protein